MRPTIKGFEDLIVWQKAHQLTLMIYKETRDFPKHELYGIVSQLKAKRNGDLPPKLDSRHGIKKSKA